MQDKQTTLEQSERGHITYWIIFIGIILVGSTLRAPLTSVGYLITLIREDLQLSYTLAGMITTLPLLAFTYLSPLAPRIFRRFGMERTIFFSLVILLVGIIVCSLFGVSFLFIGTCYCFWKCINSSYYSIKFSFTYGNRYGIFCGVYECSWGNCLRC